MPARVGTGSEWTAVAAGSGHSLALRSDGTLWAWGRNGSGELGDGTLADRHAPVRVGTNADWTAVVAGAGHSVALRADGSLWAWGDNAARPLGDGTTMPRGAPVGVGGDAPWTSVAAAGRRTFAIRSDGSPWGWGDNARRLIALDAQREFLAPVRIGSESDWAGVSVGDRFGLAIKKDGSLWGWGNGETGALGDGAGARGDAHEDSDLDLLVVLPSMGNKRETAVAMLKSLRGIPAAIEVIPTDPDEIARRGQMLGDVLRAALREGKVVYERRG